MRYALLITLLSFSSSIELHASTEYHLSRAKHHLVSGDIDSSIFLMDMVIEEDSSCGSLYLIRGYIKLWKSDQSLELSAIKDFEQYISQKDLSLLDSCTTSNAILEEWTGPIMNYKSNDQMGSINLSPISMNILFGMVSFLDGQRTAACDHWASAENLGSKYANQLKSLSCE